MKLKLLLESLFICYFLHILKVGLAFAGLASIGLSIPFAYGLTAGLGMFYGPINQILPFLLLGIGIDNMFVIVQCYENLDEKEKEMTLPERIGKTMRHAGSAITVTSGTDFAAFVIGGSSVRTSSVFFTEVYYQNMFCTVYQHYTVTFILSSGLMRS
jgi:predicted RND superfamily exporter protein